MLSKWTSKTNICTRTYICTNHILLFEQGICIASSEKFENVRWFMLELVIGYSSSKDIFLHVVHEFCSKLSGDEGEEILQTMANADFAGVRPGARAYIATFNPMITP